MIVRVFAGKSGHAVQMVCGSRLLIGLEPEIVKYDLVARKAKGTRCVVFCGSKDHGAAEVAHRSRLQDLSVHFYLEKAHPSQGQTKSKVCLDIV